MTTLTYISSSHGDWCAIYVDDKYYAEGHSICVWEWLHVMTKYDIKSAIQLEVDGEWLEGCGSFPLNLSDIPFDYVVQEEDYVPTQEAIEINRNRIEERLK